MPSPPDVSTVRFVDAVALAGLGSAVDCTFSTPDLPRLREAGAVSTSAFHARLRFSLLDAQPIIEGRLQGEIVLSCQRCLKPVAVMLDEAFDVLITAEERSDEPAGYEPVVADPARLDLCWLVEDQALLAMPLVPMHEAGECADVAAADTDEAVDAEGVQRPFQNLRDMMRKR